MLFVIGSWDWIPHTRGIKLGIIFIASFRGRSQDNSICLGGRKTEYICQKVKKKKINQAWQVWQTRQTKSHLSWNISFKTNKKPVRNSNFVGSNIANGSGSWVRSNLESVLFSPSQFCVNRDSDWGFLFCMLLFSREERNTSRWPQRTLGKWASDYACFTECGCSVSSQAMFLLSNSHSSNTKKFSRIGV